MPVSAPLRASPFPPADRDFAFVVDDEVTAEALLVAIRAADKVLIREVSLFDVYTGPGLEDGKKFKSLKRHLRTHYNLSPEQYRERWGLAADYPMVAPAYAKARSQLAKEMGLGQQRRRL